MSTIEATNLALQQFRFPKLIIARFTLRHSARMAAIWGLVFGLSALSSITGFQALYKTASARNNLVEAFGHNAGLNALFGQPDKLGSPGGFTAWRIIGLAMLIGSIWGLLTAVKNLRGEEEAGRWEMFLSGQTTARKALANCLAGMTLALLPLVLIPTVMVYAAAKSNHLDYTITSSLFFGITVAASAALFITVGALSSQLAPIRRRAALYSAAVFGLSFLVRAAGDADSSLRWLINFSPLGWVEKLRPLTSSDPYWLIPIAIFCLVLSLTAIYLAGQRDLGASLIADKDKARARFGLLNNSLGLSLRLEKNPIIGWAAGAGFVGLLYGYISKSAIDIFKNAPKASKAFGRIAGEAQIKGVETFLGVVFLLLMVVIMVEATALVSAMRSEEAEGHLDNLLVRRVSRFGWLCGRLGLGLLALATSTGLGAVLAWLAVKSQHVDVSLHKLLISGVNILPAELFIFGLGVLIFGFWPRLTSSAMYGVIAWSFLMEMIGSAINLNHYILDSSVVHHVALSPAVDPNWQSGLILLLLGLIMLLVGTLRFNNRDLQGE